jgi:hypothetical protein
MSFSDFYEYLEKNSVTAKCLKCEKEVSFIGKDTCFTKKIKHFFYQPVECDGQLVKKAEPS